MLARFNMVAGLDQQLRNRSRRRGAERKNVTTALDPAHSLDGTVRRLSIGGGSDDQVGDGDDHTGEKHRGCKAMLGHVSHLKIVLSQTLQST